MTIEEAIAIIENEKRCVNRANKNDNCNRDCYNCELVKTDAEILEALDMAIKALEQPKIIHCRECKHWTNNIGDSRLRDNYCNEAAHGFHYRCCGDDYCSYAERMTNE